MENETQNNQQVEDLQNQPSKKEGSTGALIGSIIIIFIVVAGGIYFFNTVKERVTGDIDNSLINEMEEIEFNDEEMSALDEDLAAIEAEINAELELMIE